MDTPAPTTAADFVITVDVLVGIFFNGDQPRMRLKSGRYTYDIVGTPGLLFLAVRLAQQAIARWLADKARTVVPLKRHLRLRSLGIDD